MAAGVLVKDGCVLRSDGSLARADVLIADGVIAEIGAEIEAPPDAELVDARGMIVAPGLVNAHMHSGENFNPGLYENLPLDLWFVRSHQVTRTEPPSRRLESRQCTAPHPVRLMSSMSPSLSHTV